MQDSAEPNNPWALMYEATAEQQGMRTIGLRVRRCKKRPAGAFILFGQSASWET